MAGTQELLQAVLNMQQNAQAALPVIPNNGNPRGANNMPAGPASAAPAPAPHDNTPAWVRPSASMEQLQQILSQPIQGVAVGEPNGQQDHWGGLLQGYTGPRPGTPEFQAARAAGQHPILDWLRQQNPDRFGGRPMLPRPAGQPMMPAEPPHMAQPAVLPMDRRPNLLTKI